MSQSNIPACFTNNIAKFLETGVVCGEVQAFGEDVKCLYENVQDRSIIFHKKMKDGTIKGCNLEMVCVCGHEKTHTEDYDQVQVCKDALEKSGDKKGEVLTAYTEDEYTEGMTEEKREFYEEDLMMEDMERRNGYQASCDCGAHRDSQCPECDVEEERFEEDWDF